MISLRANALIALVATALIGACGGDDILAPPDGVACTRGTIAPGDSVTGHLGLASCEGLTGTTWDDTRYDSWTLRAKKNTGYVVRVYHLPDADGDDTWDGDLVAYMRNASNDPVFATGWWGWFGPSNTNGAEHQEMYLVTDVDRTISLRVETYVADSGSYALTVESCPAIPLVNGATVEGIDMSSGCLAKAWNSGVSPTPRDLLFATFQGDTATPSAPWVIRTSGTTGLLGWIFGIPDVNCWSTGCESEYMATGDSLSGSIWPAFPTSLALMVAADTTGTTIVDLGLEPGILPSPPAGAALHQAGRPFRAPRLR